MSVNLTKNSIDLGIVTTEPDRMVAFYRDTLGLKMQGEMQMPRGGRMFRLECGSSLVKIVVNGKTPPAVSPPGGIGGATGYRYFTISVSNIEEVVARCEEAGSKVVIPKSEIRPGVTIAMVEDPDGNWVEFLQLA